MKRETTMTRRSFAALAAAAALSAPAVLAGCDGGGSRPLFELEMTRTFTMGGRDGKNLLVMNAKVRNNGETALPGDMVGYMYTSATQDGRALAQGYVMPGEAPDILSSQPSIAPGADGEVQMVFELAGDGPVEVTVSPETVDSKGVVEAYRQTIDLAAVEKVESEPTFDVKIDDVAVTDDGEGKSLVVLAATFANNDESPVSFGNAVEVLLYQNDVALKQGYLPYNHPAKDDDAASNAYTDVKKGASLKVQAVYELLDDAAPVEIKLVDRISFDQRVVLEKTIEVAGAAGKPAADGTADA